MYVPCVEHSSDRSPLIVFILISFGSVSDRFAIQHHPMTGVPTFFLHPCLVGENMLQFSCSKEDYLMIWLGLTGSCVGLTVPKEMAVQ